MSGGLIIRVGIFVAPCFARTFVNADGGEDREITNAIQMWRERPENAGKVLRGPQFTPATVNVVTDENGNPISGGVPAFGAMLTVIHAQAATGTAAEAILQEIDEIPDVRRLKADHTETAWGTIETWLRGRGLTTVYLRDGQTQTVEDLAARVVAIIEPTFKGFAPGTFG